MLREAIHFKRFLFVLTLVFGISVFLFSALAVSAQEHIPRLRFLEGNNPESIQYSLYEPVLDKYIQRDHSLGNNEVFLSFDEWGAEDGISLPLLQENTIYSFLSRAKGHDLSDYSTASSFVNIPCYVDPEIVSGKQPVILSINALKNPMNTRYAIYVPEKNQYVQLDGSFSSSIAWITLDRWAPNGYIPITAPQAYKYSYQIKARSAGGEETPYSSPRRLVTCETAGLTVDVEAYGPKDLQVLDSSLNEPFYITYKVSTILLYALIVIALLGFIMYLHAHFQFKQKKRPSKKEKELVTRSTQFLLYSLSLIALVLAFKFIFGLSVFIYQMRTPVKTVSTLAPVSLNAVNVGTTPLVYRLHITNQNGTRKDVTLYQPVPVNGGYVHDSLFMNGESQTDDLDDDLLSYDIAKHSVRIDLEELKEDESVEITFQVQQ